MESKQLNWTSCGECRGLGKKSRRIKKKARLDYQQAIGQLEAKGEGTVPAAPKGHLYTCPNCSGSGLLPSDYAPVPDTENYPHVAIIGGGIGGIALAVACLHRGIPFTLYERDTHFDARAQGYGLTLQQASKAIKGLGIFSLAQGITSTRHVVHTTDGKIIGEWGMRKWLGLHPEKSDKRRNVHIARQSLRAALLQQLDQQEKIHWGHQLTAIKEQDSNGVELTFQVNGELKTATANLIVGADGIRSSVRRLLIGDDATPLRYLGCIVILGICPLKALEGVDNTLLDSATVFQTANGHERIYMMPYDAHSIMWQLSFPMPEEDAKALSAQGVQALKQEALRRTQWHNPIPQIINATLETQVSGYPVYDRELLTPEVLDKCGPITLIGDAAHPMSPFKGQGANQALLDALALARAITKAGNPSSHWKKTGVRKSILTDFEAEMLERSAAKVKESEAAAEFLHSEIVLQESDQPRGSCLRK